MAKDFEIKDFSGSSKKAAVEKKPSTPKKTAGKAKQEKPAEPKAADKAKSAAKPEGHLIHVKAVYRDTVHPETAQMIFANRWTPVDGNNRWTQNMIASGKFIQQ